MGICVENTKEVKVAAEAPEAERKKKRREERRERERERETERRGFVALGILSSNCSAVAREREREGLCLRKPFKQACQPDKV